MNEFSPLKSEKQTVYQTINGFLMFQVNSNLLIRIFFVGIRARLMENLDNFFLTTKWKVISHMQIAEFIYNDELS